MIAKVLDWLGFGSHGDSHGEHDHAHHAMIVRTAIFMASSTRPSPRLTVVFGRSNGRS